MAEMPAEHAILGLLAATGSGYGYELARSFEDGQPLGAVLRLEPGMLYHHLKKLERRGWVESDLESQPTRPARRTYRLSGTGRTELLRWLEAPVVRTREIRLEFLVKLFFAERLDPGRARRLVAEQRDTCRRLVESLGRQLAEVEGDGADVSADASFMANVLRLRLLQTQAALAWLDNAFDGSIMQG